MRLKASHKTEAEWLAMASYMDTLVTQYKTLEYIQNDPIQIPHRYIQTPQACELVAFVTALLSYGRRPLIIQTVHQLFQLIDHDPLGFLEDFSPRRDAKRFQHFVYRFNKGEDIVYLWQRLQWVYQEYGSLENLFIAVKTSQKDEIPPTLTLPRKGGGDFSFAKKREHFERSIKVGVEKQEGDGRLALKDHLTRFMSEFTGSKPLKTPGLKFLLANPASEGACKRLNMFLRWMVRQDHKDDAQVDFGLWQKALKPSELVIPLDTHVLKMNRAFGFSKRNTGSWKTAEEITSVFQLFCPEDPVRYDYALMGLSLDGGP